MKILFPFMLLLSSFSVFAEELQQYHVELILFTQQPVQGEDEIWPAVKHYPATASAQPLLPGSALTPVSKNTAQMNAILHTLKQSALYRPLLHAAWEQPGWPENATQPVRIEIPFNANVPVTIFSENAPVARAADSFQGNNRLPGYLAAEINKELPPSSQLEGTITIHRARYLHVDLDLIYREYVDMPVSRTVTQPADPSFKPVEVVHTMKQLVEIPFRQKRRMRSKERHYIDHPRLGALIEITPVGKEEAQETLPETEEAPAERGEE